MTAIGRGDLVTYANGLYVVAEVQADLLVLDGVTVTVGRRYHRCRERVTVLAADVTPTGQRQENES